MKCSILGTSYYSSSDELKKISGNMKELGFVDYDVFNSKTDFFDKWAGTPEERLKLFYDAWDSDGKAIFATRGGSGVSHFVNKIDTEKLKTNKLFCGYSDLTLLLNYLNKKLNLITLHGPMAFAELDYRSLYYLKKALSMQDYYVDFSNRGVLNRYEEKKIKGKLIGGNLTRMIESLLHFHLDFTDKILFLEEVGESQAKILNMLFTLSDYSSFKPKAIVFGYMGVDISKEFGEVIGNLFSDVPLIFNFPFGHDLPNMTMPIGANAEVDFENNKLNITFPEEHKNYAIKFDHELPDLPENFKDFFYEENRKNKMYKTPKRQRSIENILKIYRPNNLIKSSKYNIDEKYKILNISQRIRFERQNYFMLEIEENEKITSSFFINDKNSLVRANIPDIKIKNPRIDVLKNNYYIMGEDGVGYHIYEGQKLDSLKKIMSFSREIQEINIVSLKEKIGVFIKYKGNIKYIEVKDISEITEDAIKKSEDIFRFYSDNLGGITQILQLKNGLLGILGYTARKTKEGNNVFSYPIVFCLDTINKRVSSTRIILKRSELPETDSRKPEEYNIIMPGGIERKKNTCLLNLTIGNLNAYKVNIKDPFSYYEKKF